MTHRKSKYSVDIWRQGCQEWNLHIESRDKSFNYDIAMPFDALKKLGKDIQAWVDLVKKEKNAKNKVSWSRS